MKVGDLVRFTKGHHSQDGLDYCEDWLGTVLDVKPTTVKIQWFSHPFMNVPSVYDEQWWNALDYEPFEVVNELPNR